MLQARLRDARRWDSRELLEPSKGRDAKPVRRRDVGVLRTWRAMCPELQERWPEAARPEDWEGVTMENGRVVKLVLEDLDLTERCRRRSGSSRR